MKHIRTLDGVRGIAILLVMLGHGTSYGGMTSQTAADVLYRRVTLVGWSGVDLFFVLSGFLITSILIESRERTGYFSVFYARRVLRIFPLYYAYLAAIFILMPVLKPSLTWTQDVATTQAWYWAYLPNFYFARHGFPPGGAGNLLGGFWSLAVEEQFYFVWPLTVFLLSPRALRRLTILVLPTAFCARLWLHLHGGAEAAYVLPFCRMDALAAGALISMIVRDEQTRSWLVRHAKLVTIGVVAPLMVVIAWRRGLPGGDPVVGTIGYSALAITFAWLIFGAVHGVGDGILAHPILRTFGKYSYALYVVHAAVMLVLERAGLQASRLPAVGGSQLFGQLAFTGAAIILACGLALMSWRLLESPCLALKRYAQYGDAGEGLESPAAA